MFVAVGATPAVFGVTIAGLPWDIVGVAAGIVVIVNVVSRYRCGVGRGAVLVVTTSLFHPGTFFVVAGAVILFAVNLLGTFVVCSVCAWNTTTSLTGCDTRGD